MKGKLNIFQRMILIWNEIQPYNAVHVVKIPKPLEITRLSKIIKDHLENCGLTNLEIDYTKKTYHYHGGSADIKVKNIGVSHNYLAFLSEEIQNQLNIRFTGQKKIIPFRFFTLSEKDSFYFGLVYFHLIAGAESIVHIIKNIMHSYISEKESPSYPKLNLYPAQQVTFLMSLKFFIWGILTLPSHISDIRKSCRPKYSDINDNNIAFLYYRIEPPKFNTLTEAAKKWGVTLNDMFLAILLKSVAPLADKRKFARRRNKISIASIINIREDLSVENPEDLGVFLSAFSISHIVPDKILLEQLVKNINKQTNKIKKYNLYMRSLFEMWSALVLISSFFKKRRKKFYSKYYPLWGGITNINLNALWKQQDGKMPVDYFRAVSTGPAAPLIFSFTTVNSVLNAGVSYRTTVFSESDIKKVITEFLNQINNLGDGE
jgi:NRPS condensation-like uncharacterized protein